MRSIQIGILACALAVGCALLPAPARAQATDYPAKPIRFIVSSVAGGVVDIRARRFGQRITESLKQPIVVENKPGATTTIGAEFVAKSAPDGYTALFGGNTEVIWVPALGMPTRYDAVNDLVPVGMFTLGYPVLVVSASLGIRSFPELVAWAKARPDQLLCGTAGHGSGQHFICELLARRAGTTVRSVPYKGTGPMLLDTAGGQVHISIGFLAEVDKQYIVPGKVIPLATMGPRRLERFPDLPTMGELGHAGFDLLSWTGLFVPAGTPVDIVRRLNAEIVRVVREPEIASWLRETGSEIPSMTPEAFRDFTRAELEKWRAASIELGIRFEQ
jgi:tripartite-type tricarboxylate transporter receptor subunit TctC